MVTKKLTVTNAQGFHMRPATAFVGAMAKFPCKITITANGKAADGKSLMNIIAACIKCGTEIEIACDGEREQEALQAAVALVESGFGE